MESHDMSLKTITPESLRSDAEKMIVRAEALEQGIKLFDGKVCEFCGGSQRFVASARCVNTRTHIREKDLVEGLRTERTVQLSARPWR
jgi:hypothetical protein